MNERLLQFIWQFQHYNKGSLCTEEGQDLQVIQPGLYNTHQGPDFKEAKIRIGNTTWVGHIELHVYSSQWDEHGHSLDENYRNVILHVVWDHDLGHALPFPTLVLQARVSKLLLKKYEELMHAGSFIPCGKMKHTLNELSWTGWIDRMVLERLLEKSAGIHIMLQENKQHWEQTCWWMMARNFGIRVNADAFESIARSLPLHIISRHKQQLHQVEALLFGQAGLLEGKFTEDYPQLLQKEYRFMAKKYRLKPVPVSLLFLRMRPANFPSVRLAQLAILLHQGSHLFDQIRLAEKLDTIRDLLKLTANDYWHYHYVFDEPSGFMEKKLGKQMVENILINTVIPILFAHAGFHNNQAVKQKVLDWLREIPAEKNSIMTGFTDLGYPCRHAMDSQALLHLKKNYCDRKNCLSCVIGNNLLSPHQ